MSPDERKTLKTMLHLQVGGFLLAGVGLLALMLAGPESDIGRAALYVILAIAALGAGFGMALGDSLPWAALRKPEKTPAPSADDAPESN